MKKTICLAILSCLFYLSSSAQDESMGYRTTDAGVEFSGSSNNASLLLHLALNAKIHHSFVLRAGYYLYINHVNSESGGGPMFSLGYRYYFLVRPHGFFLGIRSDIMHLSIDTGSGGTTLSSTAWSVLPAAEAGYQFLINDRIFITPFFSAGTLNHMKTDGAALSSGFRWQAGLSAGIKF